VVEIRSEDLSPALLSAVRARGDAVQPKNTYTVATTSYVAENRAAELLGSVESEKTGDMLRDVAIAHLTSHGFHG